MNIIVKDSEGNELEMGDVVLLHYLNPEIKYLGILNLEIIKNCHSIVLRDGADGWESFYPSYAKAEKLCNIENCPSMKKELGKIEGFRKGDYKKLIDRINS